MNITIAGIGNAGTTVGADLSRKGHKVTLLKTSKIMHNEHYEYLLKEKKIRVDDLNESYEAQIENVTDNIELAVRGADLIIIYIQTNYH